MLRIAFLLAGSSIDLGACMAGAQDDTARRATGPACMLVAPLPPDAGGRRWPDAKASAYGDCVVTTPAQPSVIPVPKGPGGAIYVPPALLEDSRPIFRRQAGAAP